MKGLEGLGTILVIIRIVVGFIWISVNAGGDSAQSEEEYREEYTYPSGKEYDFGAEVCVSPGDGYSGAFEACI